MAAQQYVIFKLNGEDFGVEIVQVKEIIKSLDIYKIPNVPTFIEGLINLRSKIHTIFNLRKRFNLPHKEYDDQTQIIIVNVNSMPIGFIVDEVVEIITLDSSNIEETPKIVTSVNQEYLAGVAKIEERIVILLDLGKVLSCKEEEEVSKFLKENIS